MEGLLPTAFFQSIKKQPSSQPWDKSRYSCDTTQIDTDVSARLCVPSYASRWITGGTPSASTKASARSSRPQKAIHSVPSAALTPPAALWTTVLPELLFFVIGLQQFCCWGHYSTLPENVKQKFTGRRIFHLSIDNGSLFLYLTSRGEMNYEKNRNFPDRNFSGLSVAGRLRLP